MIVSSYTAMTLLGTCLVAIPYQGKVPRSQTLPRSRANTHGGHRLEIAAVNDPNNLNLVSSHSTGEAVIRAAILLDRLKFSPGEISKRYNDNLKHAIQAFQNINGLPASGDVDATTWALLNRTPDEESDHGNSPSGESAVSSPSEPSSTQALTTYVIALEDVTGPFTRLPRSARHESGQRLILREAKLARLNYSSPLELLAEKFHSSPSLLLELNPQAKFDDAGEKIVVPNVLTPDPPQAASVIVNGLGITALDQTGMTLASYPASVGSTHDPLPVGTWTVEEIKWYPKFNYNPNLFWDADDKKPRATLPSGPRNPVGIVWIALSKKHYGIHGTPTPSKIGFAQSHGCIRLTNWDAAELGKIVRKNTLVIIYGK